VNELRAILHRVTDPARPSGCVLATLVAVTGSSYRRPGARMLVFPAGDHIGAISGGCLEEDVRTRAVRVARTGVAEVVTYDTTSDHDLVWGVGLGCHGVVQVLIEPLPLAPSWPATLTANQSARRPTRLAVVWRAPSPEWLGTWLADELSPLPTGCEIFAETIAPPVSLVIFGAGDDARPLARLADELGWQVTVADPRAEFATRERFPTAHGLVVSPADELVARAAPAPDALTVVMTHRYVHDVPVLCALLPRPLAYLGLLGPKQRAERILTDLAADGLEITPQLRARLHAPVGLDLGAENPGEVALSIVAEMRATLAARDGRPLRERRAPIHG
jgi:xanthine/CO dehydrogenase XdhC/CoxF family maturation factor